MRKSLKYILSAAALSGTIGCESQQPKTELPVYTKPVYAGPTVNTIGIDSTLEKNNIPTYSISEILIGGRAYSAVPIPTNKAPLVNGVVLDRRMVGNYMLIPTDHSEEIIQDNVISVKETGEIYVLTNYEKQGENLVINTTDHLKESRAIFSAQDLETRLTTGSTGTTRQRITSSSEIPLLITHIGSSDFYTLPASTGIPGALGRVFYTTNSGKITKITRNGGKTDTQSTLSGIGYVPVAATLVDRPKPAPKPEYAEPIDVQIEAVSN